MQDPVPDDPLAAKRAANTERHRRYLESRTPEKIAADRERERQRAQKRHHEQTQDQREKRREQSRKRYAERTPEQIKADFEYDLKRHQNMTPEQHAKKLAWMENYRNTRTEEQRNADNEYMRAWRIKHVTDGHATLGGKCVACNTADGRVIEFDHRDPGTKLFNIGDLLDVTDTEKYSTELAKCQLLCTTCHFLKTHYPNDIHHTHGGVSVQPDGTASWQQPSPATNIVNAARKEKPLVVEAKERHGNHCVVCQLADTRVLEFVHVNPATRTHTVSKAALLDNDTFWAEVAKCQLFCQCCSHLKQYYPNDIHPIHGGVSVDSDGHAIPRPNPSQ
jgi:hypothetical protein